MSPRTRPSGLAARLVRVCLVPVLLGLVGPLGPVVPAPPAAAAGAAATAVRGWSTEAQTVPRGTVVRSTVRVRTGGGTPARRVVLQFRPAGGTWSAVDAGRTGARGRVTLTWSARRTGTLRVRVPATGAARAATSGGRWVRVVGASGRASRFESAVLRLVNDLRAAGTTCGPVEAPPVRPLVRQPALDGAARGYARRMARDDFFAHVDPAGRDAGDRADAAGYEWSSIGENLGAGQDSPAEVVEAWRTSVPHCRNLMAADWVHLGLGFAQDDGSTYGTYWVQMFGVPAGG